MWRTFATPCKNTRIKGQYLVHCEDNRYVSPIVKYPVQKPPLHPKKLLCRHHATHYYYHSHRGLQTRPPRGHHPRHHSHCPHLPPPPPRMRMLHPIVRLLWATFGWWFWIPWGRFGDGCTVFGGGGVRGTWLCNRFHWFGFGLGLWRAGNLHHSLDIHIRLPGNR